MKKKIITVIAVALMLVLCSAFFYLCNTDNSTVYFTIIDNTKITAIKTGSYEYCLNTYDAHGNMKNIAFKTRRELRESAYLKLEVMPVCGVISWEEVQYKDLPQTVKSIYPK